MEIKYLKGQDIIPASLGFRPSLAEALSRISEISKQDKEAMRTISVFPVALFEAQKYSCREALVINHPR